MNKLTLILMLLPLAAFAQPFGRREPPQWRDANGTPFVHDPVMARGEDGKYYVFSTGMGVQVL
ncbi:MAG: arabinan endo-1,5-alpha-L-arabinosidase, partial [Prevotellaceae bacterium]|nr:arabinan endo-1,5-alpha-L-arabinosidase [Prevotellaceae bacterium]